MAKMDQKVQSAIVTINAEAFGRQIKCHGDLMVNVMAKIACAAAKKDKCFDATMMADQGNQTVFAGNENDVRSNAVTIKIDGEAISKKDGHKSLNIISIPEDQ